MPVQGFTRLRKHQVAKETTFGTAVTATRVVPWRGAIEVNPNRTDPDVDVGLIDKSLAPLEGAISVTGSWDGPVDFDNLAIVYSAGLRGGIAPTGGGAAKTWSYPLSSSVADSFDTYSDEWGDDTSDGAFTDGIIGLGGVLDSFTLSYGEELGPWQLAGSTQYSGATLGDTRTTGLSASTTPIWAYGADTEVYLDTVAGSIGTTKLTDAVRGVSLNVQNNLDQKRFSNGSNTRFKIAAYGRGERVIELQLTVEKTTATITERATLDDSPVPDRFIQIKTTSPSIITGTTPYQNTMQGLFRLISATDGEIGGNTNITFTYRSYYSSTLGYAFRAVLVNALTALP